MDEEVPLAEEPEIVDEEVPLAEEPALEELEDEEVPLADVPQTGENVMAEMLASMAAAVSAFWLAAQKKRKA